MIGCGNLKKEKIAIHHYKIVIKYQKETTLKKKNIHEKLCLPQFNSILLLRSRILVWFTWMVNKLGDIIQFYFCSFSLTSLIFFNKKRKKKL